MMVIRSLNLSTDTFWKLLVERQKVTIKRKHKGKKVVSEVESNDDGC